MRMWNGVLVGIAASLWSAAASADVFQFNRLTANGSQNVASQLSLTVSDLGGGNVFMKVANTGPVNSVVTRVFFDNAGGVLQKMAFIDDINGDGIDGVRFENKGAGTNFPAKPKGWDTDFSAFAKSPTPVHGVDPGEWVGFKFQLGWGKTYSDFMNALNNNTLRVGLHVQALPDGQSDSFIVTQVPVPAAVGLGVVGLASLFGTRRWIA